MEHTMFDKNVVEEEGQYFYFALVALSLDMSRSGSAYYPRI